MPAPVCPHSFSLKPAFGFGVLAHRKQAAGAGPAVTAGDRERHHHAVADPQGRHLGADLDHLPHELVAEHVPVSMVGM